MLHKSIENTTRKVHVTSRLAQPPQQKQPGLAPATPQCTEDGHAIESREENSNSSTPKEVKTMAGIIATTLYGLGGTDKGHTISLMRLNTESRKRMCANSLSTLKPLSSEYVETFRSGINYLKKREFVQETEEGLYLMHKGKELFERPKARVKRDSHSPEKRSEIQKRPHEPVTERNPEIPEKEEPIKINELYIYAIYHLKKERPYRIGFSSTEIHYEFAKRNGSFHNVQLPEECYILIDCINDGYIKGEKGKYSLSEKGVLLAQKISARYRTSEPPRKRQKI